MTLEMSVQVRLPTLEWYTSCMPIKTPIKKRKKRTVRKRIHLKKDILEWIKEIKSAPCTDCKKKYPYYVMDFDHIGPTRKRMNVSTMVGKGYDKEPIQKEIDKCELVCSNCHRERTYRRRIGKKRTKTNGRRTPRVSSLSTRDVPSYTNARNNSSCC